MGISEFDQHLNTEHNSTYKALESFSAEALSSVQPLKLEEMSIDWFPAL